MATFFHHEGFLDVVPSDLIAAGLVLVRMQQKQTAFMSKNV
jgi:hypothetical protein